MNPFKTSLKKGDVPAGVRTVPGVTSIPAMAMLLSALCIIGICGVFTGCGLQTYPYLYPVDRSEEVTGEAVRFIHEGPTYSAEAEYSSFFEGYELYYRIYRSSDDAFPQSTSDTDYKEKVDNAIVEDMNDYFQGSVDFIEVSNASMGDTDISEDDDEGYRRFYADSSTGAGYLNSDNMPLLGYPDSDIDSRIIIKITKGEDGSLGLKSERGLSSPLEGTLKRNTSTGEKDFPHFTSFTSDYSYVPEDNDYQYDTQVEEGESIYVAVFVVPIGFDVFRIYANGSSEYMTYIGYIEYENM